MMQTFSVHLNEDTLLSLTELIIINYCATEYAASRMMLEGAWVPALVMFGQKRTEDMREMLRALLREPLKNPFFRRKLNEYFERHPVNDVRTVGWEWGLCSKRNIDSTRR